MEAILGKGSKNGVFYEEMSISFLIFIKNFACLGIEIFDRFQNWIADTYGKNLPRD